MPSQTLESCAPFLCVKYLTLHPLHASLNPQIRATPFAHIPARHRRHIRPADPQKCATAIARILRVRDGTNLDTCKRAKGCQGTTPHERPSAAHSAENTPRKARHAHSETANAESHTPTGNAPHRTHAPAARTRHLPPAPLAGSAHHPAPRTPARRTQQHPHRGRADRHDPPRCGPAAAHLHASPQPHTRLEAARRTHGTQGTRSTRRTLGTRVQQVPRGTHDTRKRPRSGAAAGRHARRAAMTHVNCPRCRRHAVVYHPVSGPPCPACGVRLRAGIGRRTRPCQRLRDALQRLTPAETQRRLLDTRKPGP